MWQTRQRVHGGTRLPPLPPCASSYLSEKNAVNTGYDAVNLLRPPSTEPIYMVNTGCDTVKLHRPTVGVGTTAGWSASYLAAALAPNASFRTQARPVRRARWLKRLVECHVINIPVFSHLLRSEKDASACVRRHQAFVMAPDFSSNYVTPIQCV